MPLAYIPKSLADTISSRPVTAIYLYAYPANPVSLAIDAKLTNHWVMYLAGTDSKSIRCDPSPTGPDNSLDLIISDNCVHTEDAVKTIRLSVAADMTAGNILDHIIASGYDKYIFSPGGQGCRFWLCTVVASLRGAGYIIDDTEVETSTAALEAVWDDQGNQIPVAQQVGITKGSFQS